MNGRRRERITVAAAQLVVQPAPDDVDTFHPARLGERVTELPAGSSAQSAGERRFEVVVDGWRFVVSTESAERAELRDRARRVAAEHHIAAEITLRAQIPGRVARVWVAEGEQVEQGQRLLAIEAMKMENELRAPVAGLVRNLRVAPGARVEREDELLTVGQ